jgi:4-amino-4-deoxy-L-arabinose transferase-like glycosyltransferase
VAVVIVAWALLVPPFSVPDEAEHFAYAQSLAENGERPPRSPGAVLVREPFSTEERVARRLLRNSINLFDPLSKPAWEPSTERFWAANEHRFPRDDIEAVGPQAANPPLYYAYETVPYAAASGGDLFDRMLAMRLWSGLLMLVTTAGAWLLVGELVRDRLLQLAGAACVGLQPMATFMSAAVNPDALLFASFSIGLWLAVRVARRGASRGAVAGLLAAALAAALAKPAGLALVPAVVLVLVVALVRRPGAHRGPLVAGAVALGAGLIAAGVLAQKGLGNRTPLDLHPEVLRGFLTYLWDFYLPRLPFQHDYGIPGDAGWNLLGEQPWGAFGYLEVRFPVVVYAALGALAIGILAAAVAGVLRDRFAIDRATLGVFALTAACLFAGLHWADFQMVKGGSGHIIQGRYFLPLMPIVAVGVAAALSHLPRRRRPVAAAAVVGGMAVLQLLSLSIVAGRFFA